MAKAENDERCFLAYDDYDRLNLDLTNRISEEANAALAEPPNAIADTIELEELDLDPFVNKAKYTDQDREQLCQQMVTACKDMGFLVIKNHGVEQELIDKALSLAYSFFREHPMDAKKSECKSSEDRRGWLESQNKFSEFLIMSPAPGEAKLNSSYLPKVEGFEATMNQYYEAMSQLENLLLHMLAQGLGIESEKVAHNIGGHRGLLYLNYSRKRSDEHILSSRGSGHTDWGPLTILLQGEPGLHVIKNKRWHRVLTGHDKFVVNLGDAMNRWTNGLFRSTIHIVRYWHDQDRVSIPYFVAQALDPTDNRKLQVLVDAKEEEAIFKECSYNQFIKDKTQAFYAYLQSSAQESSAA